MMATAAARDWRPLPEVVWALLDVVFDAEWYRRQHTDIRWRRTTPEAHYRRYGFGEDRAPGPLFDPAWYRATSSETPAGDQPALLQFATATPAVRGEPNPLFDSRWVAQMSGSDANPLLTYTADPTLDPSPVFDTAFLSQGADAPTGSTPLATYLSLDAESDVSPCPLFDARAYRLAYPEAVRTLEHYIRVGGFAGASPSPEFDGRAYIERSPWVLTGNEPPLVHFLKHGVRERTAWTPIGAVELVRDLIDDGQDAAATFVLRRLRESISGVRHDGVAASVSNVVPPTTGPGCLVSAHAVLTAEQYLVPLPGSKHTDSIVIGSADRAAITIPHVRRSISSHASVSTTGNALFDVLNAAESSMAALVSEAVAPPALQGFVGADVIALPPHDWVAVEDELAIKTARPTKMPARMPAEETGREQSLRVTSTVRHDTEICWPLSLENMEKVQNCKALDVDCEVPTSILLLASKCTHVTVRSDRGTPTEEWIEACNAFELPTRFESYVVRRQEKGKALSIGAVIPTFNHASFVGAAIESFLGQEHPVSEIVVVDDGSTDETAEIIHSYSDPRVRYMSTERVGPGAALNAGIRTMESDVIAFLGSDDLALPHRAEHDLWMFQNLEIDAITSLPAIIDEAGAHRGDAAAGFLFPSEDPRHPVDVLRLLWRDGNYICNPAVSMRREAYWHFGGSPHGLIHLHDCMLWVRLAGALRLGGSTERTTEYRRSRQAVSLSAERAGSRLQLELEWAFDRFFETCETAVFARAFESALPLARQSSPVVAVDSIPLFLEHQFDFVRRKGVQKAISALDDDESRRILRDAYDLTEQRIFAFGSEVDIDGLRDTQRLFDVVRSRPPWR